ncbi:hypothetical protein Entas_1376 [Enterobacter soli]|nr:hypothetical protein Entas_1376 [Enterobacter soli]
MQYIILGGDDLIFSDFSPRNKCDPPPKKLSYVKCIIFYSQNDT